VKHEFERADRAISGEQPYESDDDSDEVDNDAKTLEDVAKTEQPPEDRIDELSSTQEPVDDVCVDDLEDDENGNHDHDQGDDEHALLNMMPEEDEVEPTSTLSSPDHQDIDEHNDAAEEADDALGEDWSPGSARSPVEEIDDDADISSISPAEEDGGPAAVMSDDGGDEGEVSSSSSPSSQDMVSSPEETPRATFTPPSSQDMSQNPDTEPLPVYGDLGATQPLDFDREGVASPCQSCASDDDDASTFPYTPLSVSPTQDPSQDGAERDDVPTQTQETVIEE
jgi:hypothetical protein